MNVFEMEKEFNDLMKQGQEVIEKLKNTQDITLRKNIKAVIINFNGTKEKWVMSDDTVTFEKAQEWIKTQGGTPPTICDLWSVDSDTQKPRWLLFKEAGHSCCVWCEADPEEIGKENPCFAYTAYLTDGYVDAIDCNDDYRCALCRVDF